MTTFVPYLVGALMGFGFLVLGALWGCRAGMNQERKRCVGLVESHVCSFGERCSARCLDKLAAVMRISVRKEG